MKPIIGECLAQGLHTPYIIAALLITLAVGLGLALWVWHDRRTLLAMVREQQQAKQRAAAREEERWL